MLDSTGRPQEERKGGLSRSSAQNQADRFLGKPILLCLESACSKEKGSEKEGGTGVGLL